MRFELTTPTLARLCSTPELRPRPLGRAADTSRGRRLQEENCIYDEIFQTRIKVLDQNRACSTNPIAHSSNMVSVMIIPTTRIRITGGLAEKP